ncbi:trypsin-like serine protease [Aestuariibacter sp. AA17]|uniref:Trypsin-like serine protease n=1 Tax=Fluctibacter corallii TaxID=2984329 RepID=A0ABT3A647_9ALTE|nr:trypsin-like serine protease [Aestuariibacter sp. AA17]MCV2884151.1 trypsin-like serine protease [Aestuariibacter sp. AA17]
MKKIITALTLLCVAAANGIVIRHDVDDSKYRVDDNTLPQLATFYIDGAHGILIEPDWVLSAAHTTFCLRTGSLISIAGRLYTVDSVFVHKNYTPVKSHDIALIKLRDSVEGIKPFSLNTTQNEEGQSMWFIGMGGTGNGKTGQTIDNAENKGQLRIAQNVVDSADGPLLTFTFDSESKGLPLEGVSGGGDSGSPAYTVNDHGGTVYGVSSRVEGGGIGRYGVKEIYSRVSYFSQWIAHIINGDNVDIISYNALQSLPAGLTEEILPAVCKEIGLNNASLVD